MLYYDQGTGVFRWRERPRDHFGNGCVWRRWNTRYVGKVAGSPNNKGYIIISIDSMKYYAHRLAWLCVTGLWPSEQIDHINGARDDNRFSNLRAATHGENKRNSKRQRNNTAGLKGVSWHRRQQCWRSQIQINGCKCHLGSFPTPEAAHTAYCLAAARFHGEFARFQ